MEALATTSIGVGPFALTAIKQGTEAGAASWHCSECGRANGLSTRYCAGCGSISPLQDENSPVTARANVVVATPTVNVDAPAREDAHEVMAMCSSCHGRTPLRSRSCQFCGTDLAAYVTPPAPQVTGSDAEVSSVTPALRSVARDSWPAPPPEPMLPATSVGTDRVFERAQPISTTKGTRLGTAVAVDALPSPPASAMLVLLNDDGTTKSSFPLTTPHVDIGRAEGDVVLYHDPYISGRHARIVVDGGSLIVRDLASTNGVYRRIRGREPLRDGDLLLVGREVLQFRAVNPASRQLDAARQHDVMVFGSPAVTRAGRLEQRTVEGIVRDVYHLTGPRMALGRERGDVLFRNDPKVSPEHAAITHDVATGAFYVEDLGSSTGTFIAIRGEASLQPGDLLRIGQHTFRVDPS